MTELEYHYLGIKGWQHKINNDKYHEPPDIINYKVFLPANKIKHTFDQFFIVNYQFTGNMKDRGTL